MHAAANMACGWRRAGQFDAGGHHKTRSSTAAASHPIEGKKKKPYSCRPTFQARPPARPTPRAGSHAPAAARDRSQWPNDRGGDDARRRRPPNLQPPARCCLLPVPPAERSRAEEGAGPGVGRVGRITGEAAGAVCATRWPVWGVGTIWEGERVALHM